MMTSYSLMVQLARLIPVPQKHAPVRPGLLAGRTHERFGCCPACREFIGIKVATPAQRELVCPACRQTIDALEPLWPTLSEMREPSPGSDAKSACEPGSVARPGAGVSRAIRRIGDAFRAALGFGPRLRGHHQKSSSPGVWDKDLDD
ncbi:hypothetical protein [Singulisphaera sp. GP187]|uniref:hypothetical protein n=1 Tax=Singulisphaera sp. GP187 TaxID=1882752 RepID=UPI000941498B|nr:hypothetical protein [Singulisphaera sp. GP187]